MKHRRPQSKPNLSKLPIQAQPGAASSSPAESSPRTDWNQVAGWYDQLVGEAGSEYHQKVVLPGVVKLLRLKAGDAALDVACGQGVLCRLLHERGIEMTGIDAAGDLITAARQRGPAEIRYDIADVRNLTFLSPARFSGAACVLAIQKIHPLSGVCEGVSRALLDGGRFVLVMMHPCFRGPKETRWGWDAEASVQYRRVDRYLLPRKSPIVTHPGAAPDQYTWTFHKPMQAYVAALRKAGMLIDAMEEWTSHKNSDSGPRAAAENMARKEIPLFLAIRAVKVAALPAIPSASPESAGTDDTAT
jgi:ubiquinone/menaquinone biosynthesis C-methylase UbiE